VIPPAERARLRAAAARADAASVELKAAVSAAWRAGGSVRVIAEELGKSTRTIQNWLKGLRQEAPSPES
jgi:transposase